MTNGTLMVGAESDPLVHGILSRKFVRMRSLEQIFLAIQMSIDQHDTGGKTPDFLPEMAQRSSLILVESDMIFQYDIQ